MALSAAISVTSNEHLYLSAPLQLHLHLLWPNIWSDSKEEYEKETCGILDHLSTSHLNHNSPQFSQWCIYGFVRRISGQSVLSLSSWLPLRSRSSPRRLAVTLLKQQREGREQEGPTCSSRGRRVGMDRMGCGGMSERVSVMGGLPRRVPDSISGREVVVVREVWTLTSRKGSAAIFALLSFRKGGDL